MLRQRAKLESSLQLRYSAPSLTLRTSPGLGTHVHLAKAKRDQGKLHQDLSFVSISESGTTKCYFYQVCSDSVYDYNRQLKWGT